MFKKRLIVLLDPQGYEKGESKMKVRIKELIAVFMLVGILLMNARMQDQADAYNVTASKTGFTSASIQEGEKK